jgi:hypothetical protein
MIEDNKLMCILQYLSHILLRTVQVLVKTANFVHVME